LVIRLNIIKYLLIHLKNVETLLTGVYASISTNQYWSRISYNLINIYNLLQRLQSYPRVGFSEQHQG
jgi:hypothetical protein